MLHPVTDMKANIERTLDRVEQAIYQTIGELHAIAWVTPEPVPYAERTSGTMKSVAIGEHWGQLWDCAWFHFSGEVPASAADRHVVLLIDVGGEGCVFDEHGEPVQGLTNVSSEYDARLGKPGKRVVEFAKQASGGERIDLWVEAGTNDLFGKFKDDGALKDASIAVCHDQFRALYYDMEVLKELMDLLPQDSARHQAIFLALSEASLCLNDFSDEEAQQARQILAVELHKKGGDPSLTISAIGHAHIDLAWLWPIRETIRKGARTFSTVLMMMDRYPDYLFGASQPQLYQWIKDSYPGLYDRIKRKIAESRWEAQGAMWVESDTNLAGGEALVRQIIYGKRFFSKEFGKEMKLLWLPDVFGYSGALPQLLKKSGIDYFMTIKLSWSLYNQHPHHTFLWAGIDGSKVLAHMPPEGVYNSSAAPRAIMKTEQAYRDKGVSDACLLLFGIGDGGGGPGEEHLERLQREKNLNGLAPVVQESALEFFQRLEQHKHRYDTWSGELYLERHQGTYTTQAKNKWFNRKMELKLRDLEFVAAFASLLTGFLYPKIALETIWKETLLYQFHDILPGSSIKRVHDESLVRYTSMYDRTWALVQDACQALINAIDTGGVEKPVIVLNSLSWERQEWVNTDHGWLKATVPAMGYAVLNAEASAQIPAPVRVSEEILENDRLTITFNADGTIGSIYDKEQDCEVIAAGEQANQLVVYHDDGDAWDFNMLYQRRPTLRFTLESREAWTDGPCGVIRQRYTFGQSTLQQDIVLRAGSRRIDFVTSVEWRESGKMLRALFPVTVRAQEVTCDIQFGTIRRPTHDNTSWDRAKQEICAHKWIDVSRPDYGVALLNDCKYGHRVVGHVMEIHLLRSPNYPGEDADKGHHELTYALYPHAGDHIAAQVNRIGYELNVPLMIYLPAESKPALLPSTMSFIEIDRPEVVIETVKQAEDSQAIVVRIYESCGMQSTATIRFNMDVRAVHLADLLEQTIAELPVEHNTTTLMFKPFEIHTLIINRG